MKRKSNLGKYFMELLIVVLGVSVAFWINTVAETNKEEKVKQTYYNELIADLGHDIKSLEFTIKENTQKQENLSNRIKLYDSPNENKDQIAQTAFMVGNYIFFESEDLTYQSILASGDLKLFKNREVKKGLVSLYSEYKHIEKLQNGFLDALDQNYFPYLVKNIDYSTGKPINSNFHKSTEVKNYIIYTINEIDIHLKRYEFALLKAKKVQSILKSELNPE